MHKKGKATRYPGVTQISEKTFMVRGKVRDPKTGKEKQTERIIEAASAREAAAERIRLIEELDARHQRADENMTVGAFAKLWLESKEGAVGDKALEGYSTAIDLHILPILGDHPYYAVDHFEVQSMVNKWRLKKQPNGRVYSRASRDDWFRVFRNMTRDAMVQLNLPKDPTLRITFGDDPGDPFEEDRVPDIEECEAFLDAMVQKRPGSYALAKTASLTGQRFCHVSALQIGDLDFDTAVIRFRRKQVDGVVGAISPKKPVAREVPMLPELVETLRVHIRRLEKLEYPTGAEAWLFPNRKGGLRRAGSLAKAFKNSAEEAGLKKKITPHKLRYFFNDALRAAGVDPVTAKALTGHVTEQMRDHYSTVRLDEKRKAMEAVGRTLRKEASAEEVRTSVRTGEKAA